MAQVQGVGRARASSVLAVVSSLYPHTDVPVSTPHPSTPVPSRGLVSRLHGHQAASEEIIWLRVDARTVGVMQHEGQQQSLSRQLRTTV